MSACRAYHVDRDPWIDSHVVRSDFFEGRRIDTVTMHGKPAWHVRDLGAAINLPRLPRLVSRLRLELDLTREHVETTETEAVVTVDGMRIVLDWVGTPRALRLRAQLDSIATKVQERWL